VGHGHVQRLEDEVGAQVARHGPADDPAAEGVEHHGQVRRTLLGHPDLDAIELDVGSGVILCTRH
jgi:hypothetical protein